MSTSMFPAKVILITMPGGYQWALTVENPATVYKLGWHLCSPSELGSGNIAQGAGEGSERGN